MKQEWNVEPACCVTQKGNLKLCTKADWMTKKSTDSKPKGATNLGSIDELVSQALSDGLDVAEGALAGPRAQQPDGLVHPTQRRHIHGLTTDSTGTADTGRVLTGPTVDDGVHDHLQRVLASEQVDDLEGVLDDLHSKQLFAVVAAVHHHGVGETLHDRALGLTEPLGGVPARRVGQVLGMLLLHCDVIGETDVADLDITRAPAPEQLCFQLLCGNNCRHRRRSWNIVPAVRRKLGRRRWWNIVPAVRHSERC